jgi:hypothetical protein
VTTYRNDDERLPAEGAVDIEAHDADAGSLSDEERAEAAEIRAEIDETREEMGGTLQELGDRLEPGHLVKQAKDNVRDATIGRVEETARGMSDMVMDTIKRNPIPAAMAGAGLALLWMNRSDGGRTHGSSEYRVYRYGYGGQYEPYRQEGPGIGQKAGEKAGEIAGTVGNTVSGAMGTVTDGAGQAASSVVQGASQAADEVGWRLDRFMQTSPLAMGAIALGAGAVAGSIIPETPQEQQLLGDASRQVADTVRQTVDDVANKAEETLEETDQKVTAETT